MMTSLIRDTKQFIEQSVTGYRNPAILWSGGKDSMVLLHFLRSMNYQWPVILYRSPFFPHKYAFIDRIIYEWRLQVFTYPPLATGLRHKNQQVEVISLYRLGPTTHLQLPTNMIPIEQTWDWVCGLNILNRPTGTIQFPWDIVYLGHKSSDTDVTEGHVILHTSLQRNSERPDAAFPLRYWTDENIWDYTEQHQIPVQETRYERTKTGWREREDKTYNPDCTPICIRCIDRRLSGDVNCPLLGKKIPNVSHQVAYLPDHNLTYFGEPVHA